MIGVVPGERARPSSTDRCQFLPTKSARTLVNSAPENTVLPTNRNSRTETEQLSCAA